MLSPVANRVVCCEHLLYVFFCLLTVSFKLVGSTGNSKSQMEGELTAAAAAAHTHAQPPAGCL